MNENTKPRRALICVLIVILLLAILVLKFPLRYAFDEYWIWHGEGVEDEGWKEMIYAGSLHDRQIAQTVLDRAEEAFSAFPEDLESAYDQFGALGIYCMTGGYGGDPVSESHSLELISANVKDDAGYMWVRYSQTGYDTEGNVVCGSWDVSSRWTIEKDADGTWSVTAIHEHP